MEEIFEISISLYPKKFINNSIKDFKQNGIEDILYKKGKIIISGDNKEDITEIFNEFMNYTLGIMQES